MQGIQIGHVCKEVIYTPGAGVVLWDSNSGDGILCVWEDRENLSSGKGQAPI